MTKQETIKIIEKEIERLKDDYAKLQEQFAKYQMASDKEIIAQKKQAVKEIERLKAENACLLKACEGQFIFDTTENRTYSIFNSVRKEFAEKLKKCSYTDNCFTDGKWHRYVLVSDIEELLREYENGKQI